MSNAIYPITWSQLLKANIDHKISIVDDYLLVSQDRNVLPLFSYPFKIDFAMIIICEQGFLKGQIGLSKYMLEKHSMAILPAGVVLSFEQVSDDFKGYYYFQSKQLSDDIVAHIDERITLASQTQANPILLLDEEEYEQNILLFHLIENSLKDKDNPYLKKSILYLLLSLFYRQRSKASQVELPTMRYNQIYTQFMELVKKYFKKERQVKFYAQMMNFTPKYLSTLIKDMTGRAANSWIDEYVMLEAKVLLKSSTLTIQEISDELNFPDQSTFGKYFKQHAGMSPKNYRPVRLKSALYNKLNISPFFIK